MSGAGATERSTIRRENRNAAVRRVLVITLAANLAIISLKLTAGLAAGALSVYAEAAHSFVDASNNVIALVLASIAAQAPDEEHPYGHGKFETLGALAIVAFLAITIFELVRSAIVRLVVGGAGPDVTGWVIAAVAVSAVASFAVSGYEERRGRELRSEILIADASHTRSDMYASLGVVLGLVLVRLGFPSADPLFTLAVAAFIARAGWKILQGTVPILVDQRAVEGEEISRIARATPGVIDCHDVRSRGREGEIFAELTITVDRRLNVEEAHRIADEVERRIAAAVVAREVTAHVEPAEDRS
jgi:cation diffusion facilitator family transporter